MAGVSVALRTPFRSHGKGFAKTEDVPVILQQAVRRAASTRCTTPRSVGETPWDPGRGTATHLLKHRRGRAIATAELAQHYILDGLSRSLPGVKIRTTYRVSPDGRTFYVRILWTVGQMLARAMTGAPVERTMSGEFEVEV